LRKLDAYFQGKTLHLGDQPSSAKDSAKADAQPAATASQSAPAPAASQPQASGAPQAGDPSQALLDYLLGGDG
jgi:hypothetical protein